MTPGKVVLSGDKQITIAKDLVHNIIPDICEDMKTYDHDAVCQEDGTVILHSCLENYKAVIEVGL